MASFDSENELSMTPAKPGRFTFDAVASDHSYKEMVDAFNKLQARINRLVTEPTLDGQPVISYIMRMGEHDPEELDIVGKALSRIAALLPEYRDLQKKIGFVEFARQNPDFTALTFGDFEHDIDKFIENVKSV